MMTNPRFLLTLAAAGLLAVASSLRAQDATPPGPPPPPPPASPAPSAPSAPVPDGPGARRAPRGPGAAGGPAERIKELKEKLNLTNDQVEKIRAILEKTRPQKAALRSETALSPEDRRAKAVEARKTQREQIKAILTPEQQGKFQEAWKERVGPKAPGGQRKAKAAK